MNKQRIDNAQVLANYEEAIRRLQRKANDMMWEYERNNYDLQEYCIRETLSQLDSDALHFEWKAEVGRDTSPQSAEPTDQLRKKLTAELNAIDQIRREKKEVENQLDQLEKERAEFVVNIKREEIRSSLKFGGFLRVMDPIYSEPGDPLRKYEFVIVAKIGYPVDKYGLLDKEGNVAIPFEYDYLGLTFKSRPELGTMQGGHLVAIKGDKVGIIDINNELSMPFIYSEADILSFEQPHIYFSVHPGHKPEYERADDLQELENRCCRHDWTYIFADTAEERMRGRHTENALNECFNAIDVRDIPEAVKLINKYKPGAGDARMVRYEELKNTGYKSFMGFPVGKYYTPQERRDSLLNEIIHVEQYKFQLANWEYDVGWQMDGFRSGEIYDMQMKKLQACQDSMDKLYVQLEALENQVQNYSLSTSPVQTTSIQKTSLLQHVEKLVKNQTSGIELDGQGTDMRRE